MYVFVVMFLFFFFLNNEVSISFVLSIFQLTAVALLPSFFLSPDSK